MLCHDATVSDVQTETAITCGQLQQHRMRSPGALSIEGPCHAVKGDAWAGRFRCFLRKAGSLCLAALQAACCMKSFYVDKIECKSHGRMGRG